MVPFELVRDHIDGAQLKTPRGSQGCFPWRRQDSHANYVIQCILERGRLEDKRHILEATVKQGGSEDLAMEAISDDLPVYIYILYIYYIYIIYICIIVEC